MTAMTQRERLQFVFDGQEPDRLPVLGGWIASPAHICEITGASRDEYWSDPHAVSLRAYETLGTDGLVTVFVPRAQDGYRCVDAESFVQERSRMSLEAAVAHIDAMPTPDAIERDFQFEQEYATFRAELVRGQEAAGDMLWMPAQWATGARAGWYGAFGYENYFSIVGLYPDRARKLMEVGGAQGRCRARLIARAVREGIYPRAVLLGEDICTQRGPMLSPRFLEQYYAPELQRGWGPLLEVGCKPVWHCDGDVRPILDMLIDCGVQGLQGFQPECGLTIDWVVEKRTRDGGPLLIFGPLAVTTELPVCSADEVEAKVRHAFDAARGRASLVLFTANTITPDVPLENIRAMYEAALECQY